MSAIGCSVSGREFRKVRNKFDPELARKRKPLMITGAEKILADRPQPPASQARFFQAVPSKSGTAVTKEREFTVQTEWMLAIRDRKDKSAFAQLFDFYAPRLKGFVMRGGAGAAEAEEIVQDVMLTIWRKADQFDPERAQVSGWIYQITRNRQIDLARKGARAMPEDLAPDEDHEPDSAQIVALEQEASKLKKAISGLKPDQRSVIEHAYLGELTHQEIHDLTGLPLGTIKSRIRLGLERLRHELKGLREP